MGLKNEFELAMLNEPSVFEPLRFYCIWSRDLYFCSHVIMYYLFFGVSSYIYGFVLRCFQYYNTRNCNLLIIHISTFPNTCIVYICVQRHHSPELCSKHNHTVVGYFRVVFTTLWKHPCVKGLSTYM